MKKHIALAAFLLFSFPLFAQQTAKTSTMKMNAGIITERTRPIYAMWVDMDELKAEDHRVAGEDIAEEALGELREINRGRKKIGRASRPMAS